MTSDAQPPSNGYAPTPQVAPAAAPATAPAAVVEAATVLPLSEDDETAAVMDGHLQTMERFLETGAEIMQAYLGTPLAPVVEHAGFPLIGNVVVFEPGGELVARREFDPAEDRYLLDHTLGRTVSRTDPGLFALALMPLAMSLEILAEAAACLVPGRIVTGMRDVRGVPLALVGGGAADARAARTAPRRPPRARSRSRRAPHGRGRRGGGEPGGRGGLSYSTRSSRSRPAAIAPDLSEGRPSRFEPGRLYEEAMFHGESWQGGPGH